MPQKRKPEFSRNFLTNARKKAKLPHQIFTLKFTGKGPKIEEMSEEEVHKLSLLLPCNLSTIIGNADTPRRIVTTSI
jgi:hypothetical protein